MTANEIIKQIEAKYATDKEWKKLYVAKEEAIKTAVKDGTFQDTMEYSMLWARRLDLDIMVQLDIDHAEAFFASHQTSGGWSVRVYLKNRGIYTHWWGHMTPDQAKKVADKINSAKTLNAKYWRHC